jgi:hypothetical protein
MAVAVANPADFEEVLKITQRCYGFAFVLPLKYDF